MSRRVAGLALVEREELHGRVRHALVDTSNGVSVDAAALTIDPLELSDGDGGTLRVDGIGNVFTLEDYRGRGLATQLLEVAIERMRTGGADGSLLYGIDGFYEPLGWRSCGDERWVTFEVDRGRAEGEQSPAGSHAVARAMVEDDRAAVRALYAGGAARTIGAVVRPDAGAAWSTLDPAEAVVVERDRELVGYAWRGRGTVSRDIATRDMPGCTAFVELHATDIDAAWHLVHAARAFASSAGDELAHPRIVTGAPDGHPLRELARAGHLDAHLVDVVRPHGGVMLLPFTDAATAIAADSFQFLPDRF